MKKFQFILRAETESIKDIITILSEAKDSVEQGMRASQSSDKDLYYQYNIDEIK